MIVKKALLILVIILTAGFSCTNPVDTPTTRSGDTVFSTAVAGTPAQTIEEAIVQVWVSGELVGTGIVVGDGSSVLTVMNYEVSMPGDAVIVTSKGASYLAITEVIDSRTGATLLKLADEKLPVATLGDSVSVKANQRVTATDWYQPYLNRVIGDPAMRSTELIISTTERMPLYFSASFPGVFFGGNQDVYQINPGGVITDGKDHVLGLVGVDCDTLFPHPHPVGGGMNIVSVGPMSELLRPDANDRPQANGPLLIVISGGGATALRSGYFPDYENVSIAVTEVLSELGDPLAPDDIPPRYDRLAEKPEGSIVVTVVYAYPIELKSGDGAILAEAKWVGIQWGRSGGEPNRVLYGNGVLNIKGGFYLNGDITQLAKVIKPLGYNLP